MVFHTSCIKMPRPCDCKLRPIIAGLTSQRQSNLLDTILKPLCNLVASVIRDNTDFLNYISKRLNKGTLLIRFDHNLGRETREILDTQIHTKDSRNILQRVLP